VVETFTVVGDERTGLWTWQHPVSGRPGDSDDRLEVVGINPDTGATRVVKTFVASPFPAQQSGLQPGQAVVAQDSLLLLSPPFRVGGWLGYDRLVKLPLKALSGHSLFRPYRS
jgi:hypothetical protein